MTTHGNFGQRLVSLTVGLMLPWLLTACAGSPSGPAYFNAEAWNPEIRSIALVEVSFDPRYSSPTDFDLERELRIFLGRELAKKGYRLVADVPPEADAALAVHIDYWFISANWGESNPPPSVEFEAVARLRYRHTGKELWRDRANGRAGGPGGWPFSMALTARHEALKMLAQRLFDSLPDAGHKLIAGCAALHPACI